jgi:DHA1 family tetracycline resistance protein-like MFS transporter
MSEPPGTAPRAAAVAFIMLTVGLDVVAFGIVIPVLPGLITAFLHGDVPAAARTYGLFGVGWAAMQFIFSPLLGVLSDRYGRRSVLLISLTGLGLDYVLMALAPSLAFLLVGRLISGITAATYSTAAAYIADVTPAAGRARAFGFVHAAWGIGFMIGPGLGGVLHDVSARLPFWVAAALTLANATYGLLVLPESLPPERRATFSWRRANPLGSLALLRSRPGLLGLAAVQFLYYFAHYVLPSTFVLYAAYRYHWSETRIGLTLTFVGLCTALVQGLLVGRLVAWLGERRAVMVGLAAGAAAFAGYAAAPTGRWFLCAVPLGALMGLYAPAAQALMTSRMRPEEQGQLQGANSSLMGVVGLMAPAVFPFVFAAAILRGSGSSGAPFYLAALCVVGGLLIALKVAYPLQAAAPAAS